MGSGPEDYLICNKCNCYQICATAWDIGVNSGLVSCWKDHSFCKECFPEIFDKIEKAHSDPKWIEKATNYWYPYGIEDLDLEEIKEEINAGMPHYFAETGHLFTELCPFCKSDSFFNKEFNEYSGFNIEFNSLVRI